MAQCEIVKSGIIQGVEGYLDISGWHLDGRGDLEACGIWIGLPFPYMNVMGFRTVEELRQIAANGITE